MNKYVLFVLLSLTVIPLLYANAPIESSQRYCFDEFGGNISMLKENSFQLDANSNSQMTELCAYTESPTECAKCVEERDSEINNLILYSKISFILGFVVVLLSLLVVLLSLYIFIELIHFVIKRRLIWNKYAIYASIFLIIVIPLIINYWYSKLI